MHTCFSAVERLRTRCRYSFAKVGGQANAMAIAADGSKKAHNMAGYVPHFIESAGYLRAPDLSAVRVPVRAALISKLAGINKELKWQHPLPHRRTPAKRANFCFVPSAMIE